MIPPPPLGDHMTVIRLHDIRENDVAESAGMSNIPWEFEYGFQRATDPTDDQCNILEEMYNYDPTDSDETVLDGLSPDANGLFLTSVYVKRGDKATVVRYSREHLIRLANQILRKAAVDVALAVQREYLHPGPDLTVVYEMCPERGTTECIILGEDAHPLNQILDLRGFPSIGKMEWLEPDEDVD